MINAHAFAHVQWLGSGRAALSACAQGSYCIHAVYKVYCCLIVLQLGFLSVSLPNPVILYTHSVKMIAVVVLYNECK